MDIDTLLGSTHGCIAPKVNNAQFAGGLMRYHSAPSSVLAGLLDDDFFPASDDLDFARLLNDGMGSFSSLLEQKGSQQDHLAQAAFPLVAKEEVSFRPHARAPADQHPQYIGAGNTFQEHIPLSAISEYGAEDVVDNYCGKQVPLPTENDQNVPKRASQVDSAALKSCLASSPRVTAYNASLIRQSSSPADVLILVVEENNEKLKQGFGLAGPSLEAGQGSLPSSQSATHSSFADVKCSTQGKTVPSLRRADALLRQSSSPAGLLSQINLEDFAVSHEIGRSAPGSGVFLSGAPVDTRGLVSGKSLGMAGWDDSTAEFAMQHFAAQRKRGRVFDDMSPDGSQRSPVDLGTAGPSNFSPSSSPTQASIDCLEGSIEDSVLCKARAKRGCATHPRSIAERQRRIKISERMKKLQDLVPNLDKQANISEMLDEVVEYVKLLQRQVQELSINHQPCNGSCQQGGHSPQ